MEEGYTYAKKHTIVYEWVINKISSRMEFIEDQPLTILKSSVFSTRAKIITKWCLKLYFNNGTPENEYKDFLGLFISNVANDCVKVRFSICILDSQQEKCSVKDRDFTLNVKDTKGFNEFLEKETLLANKSVLIPNDTLTILAEVTVVDDEVKLIPVEKSLINPKSNLSRDLKVFYNSREFSDTTIVIGDKKIKAHRLMLIMRSPVLAAMFTHELDEKKSNQIFITDITADIFEKVLEFIYTDEVSGLNAIAEDLLEAADKYQILSLKEMCEVSLCKTLKPENAIRRMDLADRHNAPFLIKYVTKCIVTDSKKIIQTEDFEKFEKSNPSLGLTLFKEKIAADV
ncbi:Similar to spop-b: Speckle-type POZ protein B (Xenopus laevis) [Cotesia congregata]|uniref:Similar to spop-b: Speckle-type POZ protein B (Xenopus laevis) n=1 Tax=Cotesia congregata TaxID=51543 RepID=A0A8J2HHM3_COTCN|nr:Similar to spop-b: Speckle-type POZ protein B (Xenopus laevis) [Cotesia congregata]